MAANSQTTARLTAAERLTFHNALRRSVKIVTDTPALQTTARTDVDRALRPTRRDVLEHVADRNRWGIAAKMPTTEMVVEGNAATAAGQMEWRDGGRWLTEAGKEALS